MGKSRVYCVDMYGQSVKTGDFRPLFINRRTRNSDIAEGCVSINTLQFTVNAALFL